MLDTPRYMLGTPLTDSRLQTFRFPAVAPLPTTPFMPVYGNSDIIAGKNEGENRRQVPKERLFFLFLERA